MSGIQTGDLSAPMLQGDWVRIFQEQLDLFLKEAEYLRDEESRLINLAARLDVTESLLGPSGLQMPRIQTERLIEDYRSRVQLSLERIDRVKTRLRLVQSVDWELALERVIADFKRDTDCLIPSLKDSHDWRALEVWTDRVNTGIRARSFRTSCDFLAELVLNPQEADEFIEVQEKAFSKDISRYGLNRAKALYLKRTVHSFLPQVKWAFHRLLAIEAVRRLFDHFLH